ncbi:MAG: alpha-L-rhamnosidase, partial [Acidobacteriaceae bacterium]|nr:alpha-L-rhamnosidase [Acidobacteriaceae bacterium]
SDAYDTAIFKAVWSRQLHNANAFWASYPLPSIALNDPTFVRPIPRNSWGGASQALTAFRAPRWMTHYGKEAELNELMKKWCEAIIADGRFCQQLDPLTGAFTRPDPGGYSPAALIFLEFTRRLKAAKAQSSSR